MNLQDIAKQLGKRGGEKTFEKHGVEHMRKMANKRWAKRAKVVKTDPV